MPAFFLSHVDFKAKEYYGKQGEIHIVAIGSRYQTQRPKFISQTFSIEAGLISTLAVLLFLCYSRTTTAKFHNCNREAGLFWEEKEGKESKCVLKSSF